MYPQPNTPGQPSRVFGQPGQPSPFLHTGGATANHHPTLAQMTPNGLIPLAPFAGMQFAAAAPGTPSPIPGQQQQVIYVLTPIATTSSPLPFQFHPPLQSQHPAQQLQASTPHVQASSASTPSLTTVRVGLPGRNSVSSPPGGNTTNQPSSPPQYQPTGSGRPSPNIRSGPTPVPNASAPAPQIHPIAKQPQQPTLTSHPTIDDDLEDTLNDMTIRSATAATITSIEDFLMSTPAFDDPAARRVIDDLRKEITDKVIRSKVMRLPRETCESMVSVFEADQALMMVQCTRERGNIVAPLIEKLGPESTFHLIRFALENLVTLAHSQGGCIALPRILSFTKQSQTDVFFEQTNNALADLFCHQYGNFVVKHFLAFPKYCSDIIRLHLLRPNVFVSWATTRSGSHLIDEIFKTAEPNAVAELCRCVFTNADDLRRLAFDQFGNYSVQSGFKALESRCNDAQLHAACAAVAGRAAKDSPYAQNIMKKVAQGYKAFKARQNSGSTATAAAATAREDTSPTHSPNMSESAASPPQHRVTPGPSDGASGHR